MKTILPTHDHPPVPLRWLLLLLLGIPLIGFSQSEDPSLRGRITDETGQPLPGVNILLKSGRQGTVTDAEGLFELYPSAVAFQRGDTVQVSYLGYLSEEFILSEAGNGPWSLSTAQAGNRIEVQLMPDIRSLSEVQIVSTGYQQLPKERATGSFVQLDEELVNRRVSTNILERLEDVTPGVIFNRAGPTADRISIRGRGTIFANSQPLIVIDNFPYDGPIENINPNDVESMTVLRDAAAASIWGAKAGNGVIVITTKQGRQNQAPQVSMNANVNVFERPDMFYVPRMSTSDFIDREQALFGQGFYTGAENSVNRTPLSPVVESLIAVRDGQLSEQEADRRIAGWRNNDVRQDYADYLYREAVQQQYALNVKGGSKQHRYFLSVDHDRNAESLVANSFSRFTLNGKQDFTLFKDKLRIGTDLYFTETQRREGNRGEGLLRFTGAQGLYPYARLVDDNGNPLPVISDFRQGFKEAAEAQGLLPWQLNPIEELDLVDNHSLVRDVRFNTSLGYQLHPALKVEALYQYWNSQDRQEIAYSEDSHFARDLINRYTQRNEEGQLSYPIPLGGILNNRQVNGESHNLRLQGHYDNIWRERHQLAALAGYELRTLGSTRRSHRYYGYDPETAAHQPVDYISLFPQFVNPGQRLTVPYNGGLAGQRDNFVSYYANAAYTLDGKYTVSGSARRDASNLFGVNANQRAVPLWSAGASWTLSEEQFYNINWLPYLRLRGTYGENGNIDKSVTAMTTARVVLTSRLTGLPVATLMNPPNPDLRWERIKILNAAIDFESAEGRVGGSVELYTKEGVDLIGEATVAPSTGVRQFRGNLANTQTQGMDVNLALRNIDRAFRWRTDIMFSGIREKILDYDLEGSVLNYLSWGSGADPSALPLPLTGRPLFSVYSLPWAGLDPQTGQPMGYLDGEPSMDYGAIINAAEPGTLTYHGPARPTMFGAFRNTFDYKGFSLSVNISYRLGYYYRRESIRYDHTLTGQLAHGDYSRRWQQPGDELTTEVPALPADRNVQRDNFYLYSSALIERGDNIRLQDVQLSYTFDRGRWQRLPFDRMEVYGYVNNLGIIWKASDDPLDPDFRRMNPLRSFAVGLRMDL